MIYGVILYESSVILLVFTGGSKYGLGPEDTVIIKSCLAPASIAPALPLDISVYPSSFSTTTSAMAVSDELGEADGRDNELGDDSGGDRHPVKKSRSTVDADLTPDAVSVSVSVSEVTGKADASEQMADQMVDQMVEDGSKLYYMLQLAALFEANSK